MSKISLIDSVKYLKSSSIMMRMMAEDVGDSTIMSDAIDNVLNYTAKLENENAKDLSENIKVKKKENN